MASSSSPPDIPFSVHGFVTDPKRSGYQILSNYESAYWRALVGNDAWGLFEVLRSFCHEGNRTCRPSIRLLAAMLGIKETRVLTGWTKTLKGKVYPYQGLIEILQQHELVVAEVQGEGVTMRYLFHVNLTPGLLTAPQLQQLPAILQKKHAELLVRCQKEQEDLAAKRRPSKIPTSSGKLPDPSGNLPDPSGKLPIEQHPINITHRTTSSAREDHNNNSSDSNETKQDVVVALTHQGISEKVASRLAERYSCERVTEKITYLTFLQNEDPGKVQNPRGWLRRAIEEDYGPPDGFVTAEEQARLEAEAAAEAQRAVAVEQQHQAFAAQLQARQEDRRRRLQEQYGTTEEAYQLWEEVLTFAKYGQPDLHYLYERAQILRCTEETVLLGFEHEGILRKLDHPGTMAALKRHLKMIAKRPLAVEAVLLPVAAMGDFEKDGAG